MGWGDLVAEAVSDAQNDMSRVESAAGAIQQAIGKVQPLLTSGTWDGPEATAWIGNWQALYKAVQSCLASLPAAEAQVVSQVRSSMQAQARAHAGQPAPR
jgi:predicted trehalose synthase